jgi:hypothetical protein
MTAHVLAERSTKPEEAAVRRAAAATPDVSQTLLAAGNMAVQHLARTPTAPLPAQAIQRCGPGGCSCGGKCGGQGLEEEELLGAAAIRRAVADRRMG